MPPCDDAVHSLGSAAAKKGGRAAGKMATRIALSSLAAMKGSATATSSAIAASATATSLADICTVDKVNAALPANGTIPGIDLLPSYTTASVVYPSNSTSSSSSMGMGGPGASAAITVEYCAVTLAYTHDGKDLVNLKYAFPTPSDFKKRFYVAGGGGYQLNAVSTGGLTYGAASGATDGGYDAFNYSFLDKVLLANGTLNWDGINMFGWQALGEMTQVGQHVAKNIYGLEEQSKLYTYFEGCSDGGREGMSQVQRWGELYDGVVAGAPAFRFAQQQVLHVFPPEVEKTLGYYPPPCALAKIVNATIEACDPLDGRTDGVISRTDLCMLNYNLSSTIGMSYYCAAESASSGFPGARMRKRQQGLPSGGSSTGTSVAQNGTVNANDVAVAQAIYDGLFNSKGERAYLSWQIGSSLSDAETTYNSTTGEYQLDIQATGGEYITRFIQLVNSTNLANLDGVSYDTLVDWMSTGLARYNTTLQTTYTDLSAFRNHGGKLLHYHGESDPSVPAASSVHYWQAIHSLYSGGRTDEKSLNELAEWYQLYLVPGAAHCSTNTLQPGPYPQNNMNTIIDWVEKGVQPTALNATVSSGTYANETQWLCQWPSRPLWKNSSHFDCVTDEESMQTWTYSFPAFDVTVN
ncbi:putative Tannase [Rhodotorula toruloides ATCC 204091]|uniref:Carboxylic ester hydrolase n=1 Tax=Rhodotorula toruloides TaxID=5286 RepID=A0A2T0AB82_RHOTO|nr:putative Tannase [Rhodotorula toruloides ATCC 204091]PRQ75261.1 putative Tannase [Rhodotorula toruloides]